MECNKQCYEWSAESMLSRSNAKNRQTYRELWNYINSTLGVAIKQSAIQHGRTSVTLHDYRWRGYFYPLRNKLRDRFDVLREWIKHHNYKLVTFGTTGGTNPRLKRLNVSWEKSFLGC